jgi:hypothetical protein
MDVRIVKALDPGESYVDATFMLVETTVGDDGEPVTTIEHLTNSTDNGRARWQVVTLGQSVPLSHSGALEWAVSFAASRSIPIVYQRDDSLPPGQAAAPKASASAASSAAK